MDNKFKKLFIFLIVIIIISISFSSMFTVYDGHITFELTYKANPYTPGTYENYTISSSNFLVFNHNASGYLNVSSSNSTITLSINIWYYNNTLKEHKEKSNILKKEGNSFYYNNTIVVLPFFYQNKTVISRFGDKCENITSLDVSDSLITQPGIFYYHPGEYILTNNESLIYEYPTNLLFILEGIDPAINHLFDLYLHYGNSNQSFPIAMILTLNSTNVVVFPVNWTYVALTYLVIIICEGIIFIVPAAILLGLIAYRRRKRRKEAK